jgi:5-hydroxyisourate hydrolase-like protein (transthyretin family)
MKGERVKKKKGQVSNWQVEAEKRQEGDFDFRFLIGDF